MKFEIELTEEQAALVARWSDAKLGGAGFAGETWQAIGEQVREQRPRYLKVGDELQRGWTVADLVYSAEVGWIIITTTQGMHSEYFNRELRLDSGPLVLWPPAPEPEKET